MKKLVYIALLIVMAGSLILSGCGEKETKPNLLIEITPPLEWAGGPRYGTYYTPFLFAKGAAESGLFNSITIYFGPEAADMAAEGALEAMGAPMYPDQENLAEVARYYISDLGIEFVVPAGPINQHGTIVADFITVIDDAAFAQIVADADRTVAY